MYLAVLFATTELKDELSSSDLIMTILLIQFLGIAGAYLFAKLSEKRGNIQSLTVTLVIWIGCCIYAYFVTKAIEFYSLAAVVGLVMGGIQALSRATYSKIMPKDTIDTASFFSFYDVTFNLSTVFGTFIYGFIFQVTGTMRNSALALATLFIIGIIFLLQVRVKNAATQTA